MADTSTTEADAVKAMEALGFREYEAKCFVALSRLPTATARGISEVTDIPRTRVYDAMDELAEKGLVSVHYSTPKRYRAVAVPDAVAWFRKRFQRQLDQFKQRLDALPELDADALEGELSVWSVSGLEGTLIRANNLLQNATQEIVLYIHGEEQFNREVLNIATATDGPEVTVLTSSGESKSFVESVVDDQTTVSRFDLPFESASSSTGPSHPLTVVLVDGESSLLRTQMNNTEQVEQAVVAVGRDNSVVRWLRTLFGR